MSQNNVIQIVHKQQTYFIDWLASIGWHRFPNKVFERLELSKNRKLYLTISTSKLT